MLTPRSVAELDFRPAAPLYPSPEDWRDQFLYFLLVDRFDSDDASVPPYMPGEATDTGRIPPHAIAFRVGRSRALHDGSTTFAILAARRSG
jgi:hypothetical protein